MFFTAICVLFLVNLLISSRKFDFTLSSSCVTLFDSTQSLSVLDIAKITHHIVSA